MLDLGTAYTIVELEEHIAAVDTSLRAAELNPLERAELWRHRVGLMEALVGVHLASAQWLEY